MYNIWGTYSMEFNLLMNFEFYKKRDIINSDNANLIVIKNLGKYQLSNTLYLVDVLLEGEELKEAMKHYNWLRKYNL